VDIVVRSRPAVTVSGTIVGRPESLNTARLRLVRVGLEGLGLGNETATATIKPDGGFEFWPVPSGDYNIIAAPFAAGFVHFHNLLSAAMMERAFGSKGFTGVVEAMNVGPEGAQFSQTAFPDHPQYWVRQGIAVDDRDLRDILIPLQATAVLHAHVIREVSVTRPTPSPEVGFGLRLDPAERPTDLGAPAQKHDRDNLDDVAIEGILPGRYLLRAQHGWTVKSIQSGGQDYTNRPLEVGSGSTSVDVVVTVCNDGAEVFGNVRNLQGRSVEEGGIIIRPSDRSGQLAPTGLWPARTRWTSTGVDGQYRLTSLPAGEYELFAVPRSSVPPTQESLGALIRNGSRFSLAWGETRRADLVQRVDGR
jgi:hypothetical protein